MKSNYLFALLIALLFCNQTTAQAPSWLWAKTIGGDEDDIGTATTIDDSGNVYTTGYFKDVVDFDPGPLIFNLSSSGVSESTFISKLDAGGNFVWTKAIGGSIGNVNAQSIKLDNSGNIIITGNFLGSIDFDPDTGVNIVVSAPGSTSPSIFIAKYNSLGNLVWVKKMGVGFAFSYSIAIDDLNNIYTTGSFEGTVDFDPGVDTFNLTSIGTDDFFISKLDAGGNFVWALASTGSISAAYGRSIALDNNRNVYATGYFNGTIDFDPSIDTFKITSGNGPGFNDVFVSKFDDAGNFIWAKSFESTNNAYGYSLVVDDLNNVYITGNFWGTVDFDPNPTTDYFLTSAGVSDIFVSKLDGSGNFLWARQMGDGNLQEGLSIDLDNKGNVYSTGYFKGTVDFDPSLAGNFNITSSGDAEIYLSKLDSSGNFIWAKSVRAYYEDKGLSITSNSSGNVFLTGYFYSDTIRFDNMIFANHHNFTFHKDIFIAKLDTALTTGNLELALEEAGIFVFPNPATNYINIILPDNINKNEVTISDLTGKTVYKIFATNENIKIYTKEFNPGVYFLSIKSAGILRMKKIIIE